ncbi:hypothetical protein GUITHDRAFT_117094 [Guillardia theta CCMP2712]|uniref:Uncharacterized protein n=1 Tax=Guillardia theta (strain CCMP2712) TaxID=905079 RepID=L1IL91_GUITC|nr:hypothetical protein GUITHDRAFT_117094 [Guillardia theta CCMP2712]EKX36669.1 hypothetical protein GUITHDRAFT_117094 [Guillardia theta CCMP2712]|eukprot:XP_005823649.1 hypothetical protein GUITHDRAFT_117094 [Guillardia theta CCMP2712]
MPHRLVARQSGLVKKCFSARSASPPAISLELQLVVRRWVATFIAYAQCLLVGRIFTPLRSQSCHRTTNENVHIPKNKFDLERESQDLMRIFLESKSLGFVVQTQPPPVAMLAPRPSVYDTKVHTLEELKQSILKLKAAA